MSETVATEAVAQAQTVLGKVDSCRLGPTLMHEHILTDVRNLFEPPQTAAASARAYDSIRLDNLSWIRRNYFQHYDNLLLGDVRTAIDELRLLREWGGGTIVDVTTPGIGRDPVGLARISRSSGVHIVMATGFYVAATHPAYMVDKTADQLADIMKSEITDGAQLIIEGHDDWMERREETSTKAGIIKVGCTWPLEEREKRVLTAATQTQRECGVAITIHTGRDQQSPLEIAEFLQGAGADMSRVVLGHLDLRVQDMSILWELAELGSYLQFDLFGTESSFYASTQFDMPSDAQRLDRLVKLLEGDTASRLLISQDICTKHRLRKYGGHGYYHVLENVVPFMHKKGISADVIRQIIVENPAHVLSLRPPDGSIDA